MNDNIKDYIKSSAAVGAIIFALSTIGVYYNSTQHKIPATEKVEQGYVIPSKLEIKVKDLDGNGKPETLMDYNGKSYLLKLDEHGNPEIKAYEIVPKEQEESK